MPVCMQTHTHTHITCWMYLNRKRLESICLYVRQHTHTHIHTRAQTSCKRADMHAELVSKSGKAECARVCSHGSLYTFFLAKRISFLQQKAIKVWKPIVNMRFCHAGETFVYVPSCMCMQQAAHTRTSENAQVYVYVCVHVWVYVLVCTPYIQGVCVHVFTHVCMYVCAYVYV